MSLPLLTGLLWRQREPGDTGVPGSVGRKGGSGDRGDPGQGREREVTLDSPDLKECLECSPFQVPRLKGERRAYGGHRPAWGRGSPRVGVPPWPCPAPPGPGTSRTLPRLAVTAVLSVSTYIKVRCLRSRPHYLLEGTPWEAGFRSGGWLLNRHPSKEKHLVP